MSGLPIIVSYYTVATRYERLAEKLLASCERLGLAHHIVADRSMGSWERNTHTKARICREAWDELRRPILWVDADAVMCQPPELLRGVDADFAVHKWKGQYFSTGTVFFNQTPCASRLISEWMSSCETDLTISDQPHLERAWKQFGRVQYIDTIWLPRSYYQVFDSPLENGEAPVVEHFQASRAERLKHMVSA